MASRSTANRPQLHQLRLGAGALEIAGHNSGALRIRLGRGRRLPAYASLAVVAQNDTLPLTVRQDKAGQAISTSGLTARMAADGAGLSFRRSSGPAFAQDLEIKFSDDSITVRKAYDAADTVYGLGEKTGWLDKRHRRYKMRTSDVFLEHPAGIGYATDPLYASFPVFIVSGTSGAYGIFVDNPEFVEFDFTADDAYEITAPAAQLVYYVLPGPTLPDVLRQYTGLTGRMPLPALWSLGYHQCRWGYRSDAEIRAIAGELRRRRHPADAIWFDIDYMDGYRVFTWDRVDFPDPAGLVADLKADGFSAVTIIDPGVKVDPDYAVYHDGQAGGHFVKHSDGREYNGSVWPGRSAFPDFHRAKSRAWWAAKVADWAETYGLAGVWDDMNEPATTDLSGSVADARHDGGRLPHASARNTYGLQMARAAHDGLLKQAPDSRPFILTRAAFSGAQTVTALWAGDNHSYWEHLAGSLPMLINLGLSGMPFVGVDIGGFAGAAHGELLARWTQAGAFYPFCRNHSSADSPPHEPWRYGTAVEDICRRYIELRYQLLPYFYQVFREAAQTGAPVMRPLVWHYPDDPASARLGDQFMVGADLIVAPILAPGQFSRKVHLPAGRWYRWGTDEVYQGPVEIVASAPLEEMPLYVRGGAVVPTWPLAQHTGAVDRSKTILHIWPGPGRLDYYEDDGRTRAFERHPEGSRTTPIALKTGASGLSVSFGRPKGRFETGRVEWTLVVHGLARRPKIGDWDKSTRTVTLRVPDDGRPHSIEIG